MRNIKIGALCGAIIFMGFGLLKLAVLITTLPAYLVLLACVLVGALVGWYFDLAAHPRLKGLFEEKQDATGSP